jgi:hypothetical protein
MSCNIRKIEGKEIGFTDSGVPSKLFKEAVSKLGEEKGKEVFLVSLSNGFKETIPPVKIPNPKAIGEKYTKLITQLKESQPEAYWSVDIHSPEAIIAAAESGRIVDVKGGMGIVTEDGDLVGLFKHDSSQTGTAAAIQKASVKLGGIKMDNFDNYLTKIYQKGGFRVTARMPFNEAYAPEGWNKELHGSPDVVFMVYDPKSFLNIDERVFNDYGEATNYRDSYAEQAKALYPLEPAEPSLESVMQYITAQNEVKEPMNEAQTKDYKNALISTKDFSFSKLKEIFYDKNGVFFVSPSKLVSSGLYSKYEAENLTRDLDLQEQVKLSIEALKYTEDIAAPTEEDFKQVEKEDLFTSFGKLNNLNPYIVQKQIQEALADTTQEEFDEVLGELPFPNFQKSVQTDVAREELFKNMQTFKKAEVMVDSNGELKPSLKSNTEVVTTTAAQDISGTAILDKINYFLQKDLNILKRNPEDTLTLVKAIEKGLIEKGYDVIGLSSKATDVYLMQYLSSVADLSTEASKETLDEYVKVYDEYFEQDLSPEKGFVKSEQDDRNFVKVDTDLKEEDVYNQQGLIKQEDGLYIRVNKKTSEELYPIVATYPERLPAGVKTEDELRKYIQSTLKNDEVSNPETGEVINLFKLYFEIPLESAPKKVNTTEFNQKQAQFNGDVDYLTKDFVGDFYRAGLKEKAGESQAYRDFYRHFKVTEKGLELINNDPITLDTISPYVTEDLKNYSLLSKDMPNLKEEEVDFVDSRNSRRNKVVNYPSTVAKFEGNISILDDDHLITKNANEEFIKLKNDVYESTDSIGNLTIYKKLEQHKGKFLNFAVEKPESNHKLSEYLHLENKPESFVKSKNYLSKGEKDDLNRDEFGCL